MTNISFSNTDSVLIMRIEYDSFIYDEKRMMQYTRNHHPEFVLKWWQLINKINTYNLGYKKGKLHKNSDDLHFAEFSMSFATCEHGNNICFLDDYR